MAFENAAGAPAARGTRGPISCVDFGTLCCGRLLLAALGPATSALGRARATPQVPPGTDLAGLRPPAYPAGRSLPLLPRSGAAGCPPGPPPCRLAMLGTPVGRGIASCVGGHDSPSHSIFLTHTTERKGRRVAALRAAPKLAACGKAQTVGATRSTATRLPSTRRDHRERRPAGTLPGPRSQKRARPGRRKTSLRLASLGLTPGMLNQQGPPTNAGGPR